MLTRNQEQEKVVLALYEHLFYQKMNSPKDPKIILEDILEVPYEEISLFIREVFIKALVNQKEIDEIIEKSLVKWTLNRINLVAHAILLSSIAQGKFIKEIDKPVIIDIAVDLAKKYLDDNDYKFINGLLDNVL